VRTFHHSDFDIDDLVRAKAGRRVGLCLPARDEEATVGPNVERVRRQHVERRPLVDEILVVDDASSDRTGPVAESAGARVVRSGDVLPELGTRRGKGEALWKATAASSGDVLAFCDADVRDFSPRFVVGLLGPLLSFDDVNFVKAFYERPIDREPRGGGRVTELMARPLLAVLFPELADVVQPLAGEFAAPRHVLEQLPFVEGYGVDLGLLVDTARRFGASSMVQVDLGIRIHRNRPLEELGPMATVILQTALRRSGFAVPDEVVLRAPGAEPSVVRLDERPPLREVRGYRGS
jgi:glucosyl-3-phosphoglycerate synthase